MSVANLIKLGFCGRYPYAYVLRTATLVEAEKKGGMFSGAVGNFGVNHGEDSDKVANDSQDGDSKVFSDPPSWWVYSPIRWLSPLGDYSGYRPIVPIIGFLILAAAIPSQIEFVLLLGGHKTSYNSRGQKIWTYNVGQSTRAQRFWMLGWVFANMYSAPLVHFVASSGRGLGGRNARDPVGYASYVFVVFAFVFAFGGFVTVGGMLHAEISYQPC